MQIILYCFVQIKVPPPLANYLNQLIYSSFAPPRPAGTKNPAPSIPDTPYKRRHCDRCGKCFTKTTFLKMHKFRHSAGTKPFLQEKLWVLREIVSKTNFPDDSHVLLTQEKRLTNSWLWYLWKIFYEEHCRDDAQISPQWGEVIFRRRIEVLWKIVPKTNLPDELHVD